ncbi:enoyl-CoA hydratase/isomerase family protein [Pandoraea sp. XY-2]|uniref:enoyl-CoA hydratase/isomerase family protein n=1 Tax=Pandoraea sp. XY-2 TaxID=2518599 RepID=UPI00101B0036|nr:enoyl-CoA hydratase/isomerase family protein [Pandoraea sp. XY-2]QBC31233.1 enoyl-CoA hydratase/isomerase family protein [Pandoraea sp. XY-2]
METPQQNPSDGGRDADALLVENHGPVRVLTMNRPERHNALNHPLTRALLAALNAAQHDSECRAIVLTGAGRSFCAGADTGEFAALSGDETAFARERAELTCALHRAFTQVRKPIVSAVRGFALGGGAGLALACDLMVVADDMRFGYPELRHGIVAAIVMANLVRQVGQKVAFRLVATGQTLDGAGALGLGIATASVPAAEVLPNALQLAEALAAHRPEAMATTKSLLYRVSELSLEQGLLAGRDTNILMRGFSRGRAASGAAQSATENA